MNYDYKLERQILESIRDFPLDLNSGGDQFTPLYPETIQFLPALSHYKAFGGDGQWSLFEGHLRSMRARGWIEGLELENDWGPQNLTDSGHARLEFLMEQDFSNWFPRFLKSALGVGLTSLFLPIAVTVITVLVLKRFELGNP